MSFDLTVKGTVYLLLAPDSSVLMAAIRWLQVRLSGWYPPARFPARGRGPSHGPYPVAVGRRPPALTRARVPVVRLDRLRYVLILPRRKGL